jgi:hypothetical protein
MCTTAFDQNASNRSALPSRIPLSPLAAPKDSASSSVPTGSSLRISGAEGTKQVGVLLSPSSQQRRTLGNSSARNKHIAFQMPKPLPSNILVDKCLPSPKAALCSPHLSLHPSAQVASAWAGALIPSLPLDCVSDRYSFFFLKSPS